MSADVVLRAKALATAMHVGQTDKAGLPYWTHLDRVANRCFTSKAMAVAWLHDAVEDTDLTIEHINDAFGDVIGKAVELLTHDTNEPYDMYVQRIDVAGGISGALAREVKVADLLDNMDPRRVIPDASAERVHLKHWRALDRLLTGRWPE